MRTCICAILVLLAACLNAQTTVTAGSVFTYTSPVGYKRVKPPESVQISLAGATVKGVTSNIGLIWGPSGGLDLKTLADQTKQTMATKPGMKVTGMENGQIGGKDARLIFITGSMQGKSIKQVIVVTIASSNVVGIIFTTEGSAFPSKLATFKPTLKTVKWLK